MQQIGEFVTNHWILFAALAVVTVLLTQSLTEGFSASATALSPQQAVQMINRESAVVVDLRDAKEFASGHIVGAVNLAESSLAGDAKALDRYRDKPLLLYCGTGIVSQRIARKLKQKGLSKLYLLRGGLSAWQQDNFPLARD